MLPEWLFEDIKQWCVLEESLEGPAGLVKGIVPTSSVSLMIEYVLGTEYVPCVLTPDLQGLKAPVDVGTVLAMRDLPNTQHIILLLCLIKTWDPQTIDIETEFLYAVLEEKYLLIY